jgi:hypothetical protein
MLHGEMIDRRARRAARAKVRKNTVFLDQGALSL